jgi:hypothetical protein
MMTLVMTKAMEMLRAYTAQGVFSRMTSMAKNGLNV